MLSTFMIYTALAGGDAGEPVVQMSELASQRTVAERDTVQLEGVAAGPVKGEGGDEGMKFTITSRDGKTQLPVTYTGSVPDAFRVGRNVLVKGTLVDGTFEAEKNSLVTKCPSKFQDADQASSGDKGKRGSA